MIAFRDRLAASPTVEAAYVSLVRDGFKGVPPLFMLQMAHVILRNALDSCDDPFVARAAECFYRSQRVTVQDGTILAGRFRHRRAARGGAPCLPAPVDDGRGGGEVAGYPETRQRRAHTGSAPTPSTWCSISAATLRPRCAGEGAGDLDQASAWRGRHGRGAGGRSRIATGAGSSASTARRPRSATRSGAARRSRPTGSPACSRFSASTSRIRRAC